jgi:hypothetical protein
MKTLEPDDPRLVYLPETDVLKARGTVMAYHDYWWMTHPEKGLVFYKHNTRDHSLRGAHIQANNNKEIAEGLGKRMYPWSVVKQFPLVLVPINPNDY